MAVILEMLWRSQNLGKPNQGKVGATRDDSLPREEERARCLVLNLVLLNIECFVLGFFVIQSALGSLTAFMEYALCFFMTTKTYKVV